MVVVSQKNKINTVCVVILSVLISTATLGTANASTVESAGQLTTPWAVKAGDKVLAYVSTKDDGDAVIEGLRLYYYDNVSMQMDAEIEPVMKIEKVTKSSPKKVQILTVKQAVKSIAKQNELKKPVVEVAYSKTLKENKNIKPKKKVIKTSQLEKGQTKIKVKGKAGSKYVESEVQQVNSKVVDKDVMKSTIVEKPKTEVVYEGTALSSENKGKAIVAFAKKYLGNKYVWGGESLENGVDCSGYMMKCYEHYGITLPHNSDAQSNCGKEVDRKDMQAGDLIIYKGHVAMYMGDNRIIHAAGESVGIIISDDIELSGILHIRRIFGTELDTSTDDIFPTVEEIEKAYESDKGFGDSSGLADDNKNEYN